MISLLKSVLTLGEEVAEIASAPVEIAVDITVAAVKPIAEVASDLKLEVKELTKD